MQDLHSVETGSTRQASGEFSVITGEDGVGKYCLEHQSILDGTKAGTIVAEHMYLFVSYCGCR